MQNKLYKLKVSTPGRVCLFGEHQDYLGLPIIASAISLRISVEGERRKDPTIRINLPDINDLESFTLNGNLPYIKERDYFRSVVNVLTRKGFTFSTGFDCTVKGNIPINSGTSSSSALIVTWINFLIRMSDQMPAVSPEEIARYAHQAEVVEFGEPGGMMDHYSTSVGRVIYMEMVPEAKVQCLKTNLGCFVLGDSEEPKDTKNILARLKDQVIRITNELKAKFPEFSLNTVRLDNIYDFTAGLTIDQTELLIGTIQNRDITQKAKEHLIGNRSDHRYLGSLLNEHQRVLRDVLKISTPKIDRMIQAALEAGAYGAKINGSGGGGCMFAYAPENPEKVLKAVNDAGGKAFIVRSDEGTKLEAEESAE